MDFKRSAAAVAASAILFYFGTGYAPVAALTWLAPLPILLLARTSTAWTATVSAFLAFLLGTANAWPLQLRSHDTPLIPVGLMIDVGMALTFTAAVWVFHRLRDRPLLAALVTPATWTALIYLVSVANPMGMQGNFANEQGDFALLLRTASVTGMWGIEFLVLFVPAAIAVLRLRIAAAALGVLVLALALGAIRPKDGPVQRVAAIATNQHAWAPNIGTQAGRDLLDTYVSAIAGLPDGVTTVVLPEQSFSGSEPRPAFDPLERLAKARGLTIVMGYAYLDDREKYNYALTFPDRGSYLKHHDMVSPPGHDLVFAAQGIGVEICLDVNHTSPARDYAKAGSRILAIPASDEGDNGWQHSRVALLRAAEHGQAVVWSDRTGEVMIADGWGRVRASAHSGGEGPVTTLVADVASPGSTAYTDIGDWFAWICVAGAIGANVRTKVRQA
ncbi:carbon-nitrogen hydrolase family protein [Actinocrispum sp. NPDC049592]|uniref:carbon-nitrogen hydrolase family protein n=1 Tax=Actinocrispum sp. NPDC049592 TaxID=3154835 RepID=UPI00341D216B